MTTPRSLFVLAAAFTLLFSCHPIGGGAHLPMPKMEDVMMDLSIAEAYSTKSKDNANFGGIKDMDTLAIYYKDVLAHHNVSIQEFNESLSWYKTHPDDIDSLYTHLALKAEKMNDEEGRKRKLK